MKMLKDDHRVSSIAKKQKRKKLFLILSAHAIACLLLFSFAAAAIGIQKNLIPKWQGKESLTTISIVGSEPR
ncbi:MULTISPECIES: hypothetical protein [Bacillus]|uniref:Uncharacterized protein n=2 Tax=Bacillus TaxID=1386 RepID=A0A0M4FK79_9BACI|nr:MULTISPECIES: hypothetical protein [Bacillus]ALC82079.1 hypothetical protein AM592_11020 [Bacillus gobiensis]MBP1083427.1 hypothetical protein [Bacillus capparidis]MED1097859.1 hypothetical protein [Bacillus capparidis]